ncbi:HAD family hydrolase [Alkalicoccobacillus murimartini]|uniref:Pyrophosphatase PpaX n=1 Tax=Alkalicoccobacillus murimartini TaxID=171685 RepID=A0ABT9YL97_9BACI|nr:HAD-IA family hydrolase [Alkalicoccobacillus murimartini]MDQ0208637.1 pyrophosphatase PpaX [Alkalicoccobacillus murimartini]
MKAILFDLDGTLHDSEKWYIQACCNCIESFRKSTLTTEEKNYLIGKPITRILNEWFSGQEEIILESFFEHYEMINGQVEEYAGVYEMLSELKNRGIKMGIVSSKYRRYVVQELQNTNLISFFDVIVGLDDCTNHKPDPEPLLKAMRTLNQKAEDCLYIGDQPTDILAAFNAGIEGYGALWGEGKMNVLEAVSPTGLLHHPKDVLTISNKISLS